MSENKCKWTVIMQFGDVHWETECGQSWCFIEGGLEDNGVKFCYSCGKEIKEVSND